MKILNAGLLITVALILAVLAFISPLFAQAQTGNGSILHTDNTGWSAWTLLKCYNGAPEKIQLYWSVKKYSSSCWLLRFKNTGGRHNIYLRCFLVDEATDVRQIAEQQIADARAGLNVGVVHVVGNKVDNYDATTREDPREHVGSVLYTDTVGQLWDFKAYPLSANKVKLGIVEDLGMYSAQADTCPVMLNGTVTDFTPPHLSAGIQTLSPDDHPNVEIALGGGTLNGPSSRGNTDSQKQAQPSSARVAVSNDQAQQWLDEGAKYMSGRGVPKDVNKGLQLIEKAANAGNAKAQSRMGSYYSKNNNEVEAFKWYLMAANNGNADAMVTVGGLYQGGQGVERDASKGFQWILKAANTDSNNSEYAVFVGQSYENGVGVPKNIQKAIRWYRKASALGDDWAVKKLQALGQ